MKIGRNDQCPCGSGRKYKKCCLPQHQASPPTQLHQQQVSINSEVARLQEASARGQETMKAIGVFVFFSTKDGNAWLLELSDMDALQVAKAGQKVEVEINESPETIEVNWSHQFTIKDRVFTTTAYADKAVQSHPGCPTASINAAIKKLQSRFSDDFLNKIHVDDEAK